MKKKVISVLLVLCMVFTLIPVTVKAARALTELHIGSINVTLPDNGNTVYSNTDTSDSTWWVSNNSGSYTLTLKDSNISTSYISIQSSLGKTAAIYANGDLNLVLQGTSTVHNPDAVTACVVKDAYGIYIYGNLNISGNGTLNVSSDTIESGACFGIYSLSNLTISENVTTNAIANDSENAHTTYGIFCNGTVTIQNYASVSATGGEISGASYDSRNSKGLSLDYLIVKDDAKLNATGRSANASYASSVGIELCSYLSSMTISNNAIVIAKGGSTGSNGSYGIYSSNDYSSGSLTVNGGNLTAISSSSTWVSAGIHMRGNININGGTVISSGGKGDRSSYGIYSQSNDITISNSTVVATAGSVSTYNSRAICANYDGKNIVIDNNSLVVAKAMAVNASALNRDVSGIISGSYNGKLAVIGDSSLYKVLAGSLDLTTGDHSTKTLADDGYTWDNGTNTLTLKNIVVNGSAGGITTDTFGIKAPADTDILLEGKNVVCAGDTTGSVSHGINTAGDSMTFSGNGEIIALGGHSQDYSYGLYSDTFTNLNGGSGISLAAQANSINGALNLSPSTTNTDAVRTLTAGGWTERVAVWYVTNPLDTPTAVFSATGTNTGTLSNVTTSMKYSVDGGNNWINITATTMDITGVNSSNDIKVFVMGNGTTTSDSSIQTIDITQAFSPSVTSSACTTLANNDGKLLGVTSAMEYKPVAAAEWTSGTGSDITGLSGGIYYVRIKAAGTSLASNNQIISITWYTGIQEATPSATFTATGSDTGTLSNVNTYMRYSVDGGSSWGDISGVTMDITNVTDYNNIMIYQIGDGITTINSNIQTISISKALTPSVTSSNCTTLANNDGKIIGVTSAMEYRPAAAAEWINGTGSDITGLQNGIYHVRVKAEGSVLASESQIVRIYEFFAARESTPNAAFVATGTDTGTLSNMTTSMKYSVDGGNNWINITGTTMDITYVTALNDIMVFEPGNGTTTTDSIIQTINITQASSPSVASSNCTTLANNDGKLIGVTSAMEYKLSTDTVWTSGTGSDITGLTDGTYHVRAKAAGTILASENQILVINEYGIVRENTPNAIVDYINECLTGLNPNAAYLLNSGNVTSNANGEIAISSEWFGTAISLVKAGNMTTTSDSLPQSIILSARPTAPACSVTQPSASSATGVISGITATMQYSTDNGVTWVNGDGNDVTSLSPGTVLVRYKAQAGTAPKGLNQSITITAYVPPVNTYTPPELVTIIHNGDSCIASNLDELILKRKTLTVNGDKFAKLIFDTDALKGIDEQTSGHVRFEIKDVSSNYQDNFPGKQVFTLTVSSGGKVITNFGGSVTVSLPYELKEGETADQVTVWYLASDGIMTEISCIYNDKTRLATFTVPHFSQYIVGVKTVWENPYSDIGENNTYYDAIKFVTNNNLMQGVSLSEFGPDAILTRGMIVTILYRIEEEPVTVKTLLFSDVAEGMWYTNAVLWAADKNIVNGYDGKFHPNDTLTREQMAAILYRYSTYKEYDITKTGDLSSYTDKPSDWAQVSVSWAVAEGLLTSNDGSLNLKGNISRGQIATVLKKFMENIAR